MDHFYDDLAAWYDLVFEDWEASMARQGAAIHDMLFDAGATGPVLDVAAGIGTQSLPLALLGHAVVARDASAGAVSRLAREAAARGLAMDTGVADMRDLSEFADARFGALIAFDNALPHLLTDQDLDTALGEFRRVLARGGIVLVSVRDYSAVDRSPHSTHPYGERTRGGRRFRLRQEWEWLDAERYAPTMIVEERVGGVWSELVRTTTTYRALSIEGLIDHMGRAGLRARRLSDVPFYQPVLRGRVPGRSEG